MHAHDKGLANVRHWMPCWMFRLEDEPDLKCNFYKQKFFPNFWAPPLLARLCKNCIRRFVERTGGADSQQNMEPCNHPWQQQPLICQQGSRVYKNYPRISKMPQIKTSQKLQMLSLSLFIEGSPWMLILLFSIVRNVISVSNVKSLGFALWGCFPNVIVFVIVFCWSGHVSVTLITCLKGHRSLRMLYFLKI